MWGSTKPYIILGSLLFLIFDLQFATKLFNPIMFTDDTNIHCIKQLIKAVNNELQKEIYLCFLNNFSKTLIKYNTYISMNKINEKKYFFDYQFWLLVSVTLTHKKLVFISTSRILGWYFGILPFDMKVFCFFTLIFCLVFPYCSEMSLNIDCMH